jgi:PAS domain S-box-containing protein
VLVVDTNARVVLANDAVARLFGVSVAELVGRPLSGVPVDMLDDRGRLVAAHAAGGRQWGAARARRWTRANASTPRWPSR